MTLSRSASTSAGCVTGRKHTECSAAPSCKVWTRFTLTCEGGSGSRNEKLCGHVWRSRGGRRAEVPQHRMWNQCLVSLLGLSSAESKQAPFSFLPLSVFDSASGFRLHNKCCTFCSYRMSSACHLFSQIPMINSKVTLLHVCKSEAARLLLAIDLTI